MIRDFTVVFEKMGERELGDLDQPTAAFVASEQARIELDELAELRRIVAEITDPEPLSFTTT
jgi:hypothetical protein